jgi:hypothetical protein
MRTKSARIHKALAGFYNAVRFTLLSPKKNKRPSHIFYCPYCKHATRGVIAQNGLFTQSCQICKRTFLAMAGKDMPGRARAIHHPDCDQGCGYHEPYGWVISADCTAHDPLPG